MIKSLTKYLKVGLRFVWNALIRDLMIPGKTLVHLVVEVVMVAIMLIYFQVIFSNTPSIGGWSYYQTISMYFIARVMFDIDQALTRSGLRMLAKGLVREGDLDFFLIKPMDSMFMVAIHKPIVYKLIAAFANLVLAIYFANKTGITLHVANYAWFSFLIIIGLILYFCLNLITLVPVFWFIRLSSLKEIIGKLSTAMRYPATVYPTTMKFLFFFVLPILVITYIPARTLFYPPSAVYIGYAIIITVIFFWLSRILWKLGLKKYNSASS